MRKLSSYSANSAVINSFNTAGKKRTADADAVLAYYQRIKERDVQKIIVQCLETAQIPYMRNRDVKLVKTADGRIVPSKLAASQRGKPDLTVVATDGRSIWIETKRPKGGEFSAEQIFWRDNLVKRGHEYHAPRTPDEAEAVCRRIVEIGR